MSIKQVVTSSIIAGAVTLAIAGTHQANAGVSSDKEKCYGVAKTGHNDCGSADKAHSCAGQATSDGDANEWVAVPTGLCEKLVGGSLVAGDVATDAETKDSCNGKSGCEGKM